jgi:glycosyltransferase involved in cell wall biosynthesis
VTSRFDRLSAHDVDDVRTRWPGVSVVMPVLNEERHLEAAICRVLDQDYSGELEVILAVGPSSDRTREIADTLAATDPRIHVVDNPAARTPTALNLGIAASKHKIIVRADGHGELTDGYIRRAVELLAETGAANVGGVMDAQGTTPFEEAVAVAIWFSPELRVTYRPRSTLRALMKQMYETGRWRRELMRRHPETATPRYLAPPVAVLGVLGGSVLGLLGVASDSRLLRAGFLAPVGYFTLIMAGSLPNRRPMSAAARARLPLVLAATHLSWGVGFLIGRPLRGRGV